MKDRNEVFLIETAEDVKKLNNFLDTMTVTNIEVSSTKDKFLAIVSYKSYY